MALKINVPLDLGLVLNLPLNEGSGSKVWDRSKFQNHGAITGATWVDGKYGKALAFDGSGDWGVSIPAIDFATSGAALSLWFKINAFIAGHSGMFVGKSADYDTYVFLFNSVTVEVQTDLGATFKRFTVPTISVGVWYHLVVTRSSNTTRVYLDGVESTTGGQTQSAVMTINQIARYGNDAYPDYRYIGTIDEVRIYNRALTAEEIRALYAKTV